MTQVNAKINKKAGLTPGQTIYYTKEALSVGLIQQAQIVTVISGTATILICLNDSEILAFANEWHTTKEAAKQQVLKMCAAKRKSIQKELDKIAAIERAIKED